MNLSQRGRSKHRRIRSERHPVGVELDDSAWLWPDEAGQLLVAEGREFGARSAFGATRSGVALSYPRDVFRL